MSVRNLFTKKKKMITNIDRGKRTLREESEEQASAKPAPRRCAPPGPGVRGRGAGKRFGGLAAPSPRGVAGALDGRATMHSFAVS